MIIDSFLLSEPHEKHLLFWKLNLEYNYVDEFIIQENAYDLKGKFKGLHAQSILEDAIFQPFLPKITVISQHNQIYTNIIDENTNFIREKWQRGLCTEYIVKKYSNQDKVIISDVDEMFDFSNERLHRFELLFSKGYRWFSRRRYWYSVNNECQLPNIRIPVITINDIKHNKNILGEIRHFNDERLSYYNYNNPLAFEYSYVFYNWEDIQRKHQTYAHNDLDATKDVKLGLTINAWIRSKKRNESRTPYDFFELIELTEENSPQYIRDNLNMINTNIINPKYKENRLIYDIT